MAPSQDDCICSLHNHTDFDDHHLQHTKQREGFITAQYSGVLDALQKQYLEIGSKMLTVIQGSFEESVLEDVLDHLRDTMGSNEYCVSGARRKLWARFYAEEGIEVATRSKE